MRLISSGPAAPLDRRRGGPTMCGRRWRATGAPPGRRDDTRDAPLTLPTPRRFDPEPLEPRTLFDSAFPNVNVSRTSGNQAEGTIAVDPSNPSRLFAASNAPGVGLFASTSSDGGVTWTGRIVLENDPTLDSPGPPAACCDPSAAFDRFGNLFLAYAHDKGEGVEVVWSPDGGGTFQSAGTFAGRLDQPTIATGSDSVWVTFQRNGSVVAAGARVGRAGSFEPVHPFKVPGSGGGNFGDVAVGAAGQVAVTYQKGSRRSSSTSTPTGWARRSSASESSRRRPASAGSTASPHRPRAASTPRPRWPSTAARGPVSPDGFTCSTPTRTRTAATTWTCSCATRRTTASRGARRAGELRHGPGSQFLPHGGGRRDWRTELLLVRQRGTTRPGRHGRRAQGRRRVLRRPPAPPPTAC